jgi:Tfp pilus assembly protein PilO
MLTCRHVDAMGVAACLGLTALGYLVILRPAQAREESTRIMQSQIEPQQARAASLALRQQELAAELERLRSAEGASGGTRLWTRKHQNTRLALLTQAVATHGMVLEGTELGQVEAGPRYETVPVRLSGTGAFEQCAAFLHTLHRTMPDTGVVALRLSGNPQAPESKSTFKIDLAWYAAPSVASAAD